jgi:phospholipid/cholesterol/gamma-HCH transport system permease protein
MESSPNNQSASAEVHEEGGGNVKVTLHGLLDARTTAACWRELEKQLHGRRVTSLDIDASQLTFGGSIGVALVSHLSAGGMTPGAKTHLHGLKKEIREIADMLATATLPESRPKRSLPARIAEKTGAMTKSFLLDLRDHVAFLGGVMAALPIALVHPKRMRWREVRRVMEKAGADALPVISVFSFLVGLVLALEAADPLRKLGAEIFIADMLGFASVRDTGPLVTAVMLAGRSGSAFAAELGTMKVNEELDALTTMGLNPMQFLVLQRVVATLLLTPLLTVYSMLTSIIGGMVIMRSMGLPPMMIYQEIIARVKLHDFAVGLEKSIVFGLIIGCIACLRGLQTGEGPRSVGISTTRSVVAGIMLVILANTIFSTIENFLNK